MMGRRLLSAILFLSGCAHNPQPLNYWTERRQVTDTLAISVLKIDLRDRNIEVRTIIADDPDGPGPAEAALSDPLAMAQRAHAQAAVNANAFAGLPDASGKRDSNWHVAQPVDIAGIAVSAGLYRSRYDNPSASDVCFGITVDGKPYIGPASTAPPLREAVNGWSLPLLVADGQAIPAAGGPRHPRTAIGVDRSGRWLYLVVVDGRQPGYSNGVTGRELADVMVRIGSDRAINVDGGGSSILLVEQADGRLATINRPSGGAPRPVPVLLAITRKR